MEVETLKGLFVDNGYPSHLVQRIVRQTLNRTPGIVRGWTRMCVSLLLPWIGYSSIIFRREIENTVRRGSGAFLNHSSADGKSERCLAGLSHD